MIDSFAMTGAATAWPLRDSLGRRLGETVPRSPLRHRARALGLREGSDLLALAVQRGCRHYAGVIPGRAATDPGGGVLSDEELAVLLLHGANGFEPFLIRAAAELLRCRSMRVADLAGAAKRERCERVLAYIAEAGVRHDATGTAFWSSLLAALGPQRPVAPGVLPHWSRFAALQGVGRGGIPQGIRWIGAAA